MRPQKYNIKMTPKKNWNYNLEMIILWEKIFIIGWSLWFVLNLIERF